AMHQRYEGPWRELVHHSGRVLQALTYQPTGAIVAAPTTSLPESVGGGRNWDYRYTWLRDASLTLEALWVAACPDEAWRFFDFLTSAITQMSRGEDLQIMFGIGGEHDLSERVLPHLPGWRGSFPVRVGNGAWTQRQVDVYGELLGAAHRLREQLGGLDEAGLRFLVAVADTAADRWAEPDQGIWEMRDAPRHHLYSKLMCWVALDRALDMRDMLRADPERVARWKRVRRDIRSAIQEHGWNARVGAFTQAFDSDVLDASVLMLPIVGFLPARDPRMRATMEAIATDLTDDRGLVYRYRASDGLTGEEGTFFLCTFWLAHAYALAGEVARARETFAQAVEYVNDVGLLSEEVEPESGELLGNFPQAFSHIGLVNAAWAITRAEESRQRPLPGHAPPSARS
ncbi:MAG: glycoside hydrolase family 15 protein, partial [Archangium sp.]